MDEYLTLEEYIDLFELDSFYQYGSYLISHQSSPVVDRSLAGVMGNPFLPMEMIEF